MQTSTHIARSRLPRSTSADIANTFSISVVLAGQIDASHSSPNMLKCGLLVNELLKCERTRLLKSRLISPVRLRTWAIIIVVFLLCNGCTPWRAQYLQEVTGHATQDDIMLKFGAPTEEQDLGASRTVWVYRYKKDSWCREYLLEFDKKKILKEWEYQGC